MKGFWHLLKNPTLLMLLCLSAAPSSAFGADARIAVAANFKTTAERLAKEFTTDDTSNLRLSFGSTGQLYAQIAHGAPFDAFLSADKERIDLAIRSGLALASTRFTYAVGKLSLYSGKNGLSLSAESLMNPGVTHIAIANPKTAPYGTAAMMVLDRLGALPSLEPKLVRGTSVAQAFQFAYTGNADLAIVATAQLVSYGSEGSYTEIPANLYDPIAQDAVLLRHGATNSLARDFLSFLQSDQARTIIYSAGYALPQGQSHD